MDDNAALVADPVTGELITPDVARTLAAEYRALQSAITEHRHELVGLEHRHRQIANVLREYVGVDNHLDCDRFAVVVTPGTPGRRSVNPGVAEEHREALEAVGLGKTETKYKPPTLADVNKHRAALVAAGVPMSMLVDQPPPGPPVVEIVEKEAY